jgi:DNA-binding transcriptional LysR family regulator
MKNSDLHPLDGLRGLKLSHLRLMAELRSLGRLGLAAEQIGMAQPAASRLLAEVEAIVGHPVHERDGRSLRLTAVGMALARRAERIQLELKDASREISEAIAGTEGHLRVGSVTGPALSQLLPVLRRLRLESPGISVEVVVATSDQLCDQILTGRLDFALGRVPARLYGQFDLTPLGEEPLGLVVRRGHPLLLKPDVTLEDTLAHDWVMPDDETLLSQTVLRWLANAGLPPPRRQFSTSSFLFTLAMLKDTDSVAPLALPVVDSFTDGVSMPFVQVPIDLGLSVEAYGLMRRADTRLTALAHRVAGMIMAPAHA